MENKHVGWLVIGIGFVMTIIVWIFNYSLKSIIGQTCSHGSLCTMYQSITVQTWVSMSIILIIFVIGLVIMLQKPKERIVEKIVKVKEKPKKKKLDLSKLDKDEKKAIELIQKEGKAMFQSEFMEKLEIGKVKTTRLLDKLEAKGFIERKRRGMNNIVVLKD